MKTSCGPNGCHGTSEVHEDGPLQHFKSEEDAFDFLSTLPMPLKQAVQNILDEIDEEPLKGKLIDLGSLKGILRPEQYR